MRWLFALLLLAGCAPYLQPAPSAPACPAQDINIYVVQGQQISCRLQPGQRPVVQMPRDGTAARDTANNRVCFDVFRYPQFVVNFGQWDYCIGGFR